MVDDSAVEALAPADLGQLRDRARAIAFEMNFSASCFSRTATCCRSATASSKHQLDEGSYDLLASEARLTSLFAIAGGDIQTDHWFRLGRPIVEIGFQARCCPGRARCSST